MIAELDGPVGVVDLSVVGAAEHHEVVDAGRAAVLPFDHVVHLSPARWPIAARVGAAAVTSGDRTAHRLGHGALLATHVDRLAPATEVARGKAHVIPDAALLRIDRVAMAGGRDRPTRDSTGNRA